MITERNVGRSSIFDRFPNALIIAIALLRIFFGKSTLVATSYKVKEVPGTFIDSSWMKPRMAHNT